MKPENIVEIYAEGTPNPASMKFVLNRMILQQGSVEYDTPGSASGSPLAAALFNLPFVKTVFIASNFVTVTKDEQSDWYEINAVIREAIRNFFLTGQPVFTKTPEFSYQTLVNPETETEQKIITLLDEYVRPAVEQDGGAISFKSFEKGTVTVVLRGACSGCPSSTVTLKAGIEALLKKMVPEVQEVVSEAG
jgi:Fe-S cluster biogenesis protein NfuA